MGYRTYVLLANMASRRFWLGVLYTVTVAFVIGVIWWFGYLSGFHLGREYERDRVLAVCPNAYALPVAATPTNP
jgi:hypothetical protein